MLVVTEDVLPSIFISSMSKFVLKTLRDKLFRFTTFNQQQSLEKRYPQGKHYIYQFSSVDGQVTNKAINLFWRDDLTINFDGGAKKKIIDCSI